MEWITSVTVMQRYKYLDPTRIEYYFRKQTCINVKENLRKYQLKSLWHCMCVWARIRSTSIMWGFDELCWFAKFGNVENCCRVCLICYSCIWIKVEFVPKRRGGGGDTYWWNLSQCDNLLEIFPQSSSFTWFRFFLKVKERLFNNF